VTLMLFVALMAMALVAVLPELTFQMKRDREEEMVHRGVQYSRAVRAYYRKLGGYPPQHRFCWIVPTICTSCANATKIPSPEKTSSSCTSRM